MNEIPVCMPKLTLQATEATFVEWLVEDGETVEEEQPIYSVATEKVESEVPAPAAGVLRHGAAESEEDYEVGTQLGVIVVAG